jgi:hypothetical protein
MVYNGLMPGGRSQKSHKQHQITAQAADNASDGSNSEPNALQRAVIGLYGRGLRKKEVLDHLLDHLAPIRYEGEPEVDRRRRGRSKLRKWERSQWFRDALYQVAVIDTDLATKDIMKGVTARAKEGNVDAAKFAMEVAQRYTPRGDPTPPVVTVNFGYLPRPDRRASADADVDGEAEEIEA